MLATNSFWPGCHVQHFGYEVDAHGTGGKSEHRFTNADLWALSGRVAERLSDAFPDYEEEEIIADFPDFTVDEDRKLLVLNKSPERRCCFHVTVVGRTSTRSRRGSDRLEKAAEREVDVPEKNGAAAEAACGGGAGASEDSEGETKLAYVLAPTPTQAAGKASRSSRRPAAARNKKKANKENARARLYLQTAPAVPPAADQGVDRFFHARACPTLSFILYLPPFSVVEVAYLDEDTVPELQQQIHTNITYLDDELGTNCRNSFEEPNGGNGNEIINFDVFPLLQVADADEREQQERGQQAEAAEAELRAGGFLCSQGWHGELTHCADPTTRFAYDFDAPLGTPVVAIASGTVVDVVSKKAPCYGPDVRNLWAWTEVVMEVEIEMPHLDARGGLRGTRSFLVDYVHLSADHPMLVEKGQFVEKGRVIAYSGRAGFTPTPHLHLQLTARQDDGVTPPGSGVENAAAGLVVGVPFTLRGQVCVAGERYC